VLGKNARATREVMTTHPVQASAGPSPPAAAKLPSVLSLSIDDDDRVAAAGASPSSSQAHTAGMLLLAV